MVSTKGYCFTLNNYTEPQAVRLQGAVGRHGIKYIIYGREVAPTTGTPHLQGYLQTTTQNPKRIFEEFGTFLTKQIATATKAMEYCKKEGDFFEAGEFDENVKGTKEKKPGERTDILALKETIKSGKTYDEICDMDEHFAHAARYGKFIQERIAAREYGLRLKNLREHFAYTAQLAWQENLLNDLAMDPHPRKIVWIWGAEGGKGKSTTARHLMLNHNALIITGGKRNDIAYLYAKQLPRIVVFDLPRASMTTMDHLYAIAEDMKNMTMNSMKYDSTTVINTCHVVFLTNFAPDMTKWSEDRYDIRKT